MGFHLPWNGGWYWGGYCDWSYTGLSLSKSAYIINIIKKSGSNMNSHQNPIPPIIPPPIIPEPKMLEITVKPTIATISTIIIWINELFLLSANFSHPCCFSLIDLYNLSDSANWSSNISFIISKASDIFGLVRL